MSNEKEEVGEEVEKLDNKHNWGAADLEKVTDHQEEKDDATISSDALGKLMKTTQQATRMVVSIKKEDVQLVKDQLELPQTIVERKLIEVNGDVARAIRELLCF